MADPVYKRVTDLDAATLPLATGDEIPVSQSGTTKKATFGGIFGSGWFAKLFAPLASFVAPEATHATDADTCGTELPSDFHDATQLTGVIHLDRIPSELTGKNAATADLADAATLAANASAIEGLSLSAGAAGTYGTQNINENTAWVIPAGLYMISAYGGGGRAVLQIYSGSTWYPAPGSGIAPATGLMLSDGVNYRILALDTNCVAYYRKLL